MLGVSHCILALIFLLSFPIPIPLLKLISIPVSGSIFATAEVKFVNGM